jgi:hypothetical protein
VLQLFTYTVFSLNPNEAALDTFPKSISLQLLIWSCRTRDTSSYMLFCVGLSGAAGYLESFDGEYEEQPDILAHGGSSPRVLESRLQMVYLRA